VGAGVAVDVRAGATDGVGLAVGKVVGTNPVAGGTGEQADNKTAIKSKVAGNLNRGMLNPIRG